MKRFVVQVLSGRAWWIVFAALIAAPAITLGLLSLRSIRAERMAREQQTSESRRQFVTVVDATLRTAIEDLQRKLLQSSAIPQADVFQLGNGVVLFPNDKVYFGDYGKKPAAAARHLSPESLEIADQAQAAEAHNSLAAAITAYSRLASTADLGMWAEWQTNRLRYEAGDRRRIEKLSSVDWSRGEATTPTGLPLALLASSYAENVLAADRRRFLGLLAVSIQRLDTGSWWLGFDERVAHRAELSRVLELVGSHSTPDRRLDELSALDKIVRRMGRTVLLSGGPHSVGVNGRSCLLPAVESQTDPNWVSGAFLCGSRLEQMVDRVLRPVLGSRVAAIRDAESGAPIWGPQVAITTAAAQLMSVGDWQILVPDPPDVVWPLIGYGFIVLLFFLLLLGVLMTGQVVGREIDLARQQADFMASVTHEFKTPLTSIRLHLERLLSRRVRDPEVVGEYYEVIGQQAGRLERMVNQILEAHRIRSGNKEYVFLPCSPLDLVTDSLTHLRSHAEARQIRVHLDVPRNVPAVPMDRDSVREAVDNLIDNAIRYSPENTDIHVRIEPTSSELRIEVQDHGIGIDPSDMPRIFDRFYRGKRGDRYNVQGTGLGLSLVKATALAHGGSVHVNSKPGQGSKFTIRLPLDPPLAQRTTHGS